MDYKAEVEKILNRGVECETIRTPDGPKIIPVVANWNYAHKELSQEFLSGTEDEAYQKLYNRLIKDESYKGLFDQEESAGS